jgi:apolipoprotein N-acyltransferase
VLTARARVPLLLAAALVGAAAYPRIDWWLGAWLFLAPVFALAITAPPRRALADGWLHGSAFFVVLLRWLDHTFGTYSAIPWPLSWLPIAALAAYCGLYVGAVSAALAWLAPRLGAGRALAAAPALWVAGEWVRGWLMDGFPWGLLGYSQHGVLPVIQIAELAGVYGVSFVIVAANAALAGLAALGWRRALPGVAAASVLALATVAFGLVALRGLAADAGAPRIPIAVIQPNVEQALKWDPAHRAEILARYERLTREAAGERPAVILWPETAAPILLRADPPLLAHLIALSGELGTPLLVGSVDRQEAPRPAFLNSAFLLTGQGITSKYDKIHLVPFGEYVPLSALIGFVRSWAEFISDFAAGARVTVFPLGQAPFGTVICYEVIFPELFRQFVAGGAAFMANITNDAWFGETSGPWQHLGTLPLRAVENRVSIARAANTGISAFVEPTGRIAAWLPLGATGVLARPVVLRQRAPTLYTRYGDWLPWCCVAAVIVILGTAWGRTWARHSRGDLRRDAR